MITRAQESAWNLGADRYEGVSRGFVDAIKHCIFRLSPQKEELILDLATGTGCASRIVARKQARVVGIDISGDMIQVAKSRARESGLFIEYRVGNAEDLPFKNRQFDAILSTFGVMFVSKPETAAAELARICRKGGRIALTAWTPKSTVSERFEIMRKYETERRSPAARAGQIARSFRREIDHLPAPRFPERSDAGAFDFQAAVGLTSSTAAA